MKRLEWYIAKSVLMSIALVTLLLVGLQVFILFVNQLDALGKGDYGLVQAMSFVLLQLPYQMYLFFPMASLLGCLIGLGVLANHHELVVMRAAGMSIAQVTGAVLKVAFILISCMTWFGETWVPKLAQKANDEKNDALNAGHSLRTAKGLWLRYENDFITIASVSSDATLHGIIQFHFDTDHRLRWTKKIESAMYVNGHWNAYRVAETLIYPDHTAVHQQDKMKWNVSLKPVFFNVSHNEPDEMTLSELKQYIYAQKSNHQSASNYQFAYWQRLIQPLTTMVMMILAIPFIFGPLRSSTMGSKLVVGATVGFGFHLINRFVGPLSQVYQWPPELAALAPTCVFALLGIYWMSRVK